MEKFPIDNDDDEVYDLMNPIVKPRKVSLWIVVAAFFELIGNFFKAFSQFFDALTEESLARFRYARSTQEFQEQAAREIEMLTSGVYDAPTTESGGRVGSGSAE